jgi:hypothetical protein
LLEYTGKSGVKFEFFCIGKDAIIYMHGIYTCIQKKNHVLKQYNVAAILSLKFMVPISLAAVLALMNIFISTIRSMCVVLNKAVFCRYLITGYIISIMITIINIFIIIT